MNVNIKCGSYAFSGSSFSERKKPNFLCFFDLEKAQCVEKQPEFQSLKKSQCENRQISKSSKKKNS